MPITLQKRSNILCLAVHFRLLGGRQGSAIAKKLQKERDFCFHNGQITTTGTRSYEKRVKSPSKGKRAYLHKARRQNHTSQQGQQGRTCEKYRALATTAGQNPRYSHESQRGQQDTLSERRGGAATCNDSGADPAKPTRPPTTATGRISRRRAATMEARKARQGGRNADTVRMTKGSAEASRRTLPKR